MSQEKIEHILERYLAGTSTPEEEARINAWLDQVGKIDNDWAKLDPEQKKLWIASTFKDIKGSIEKNRNGMYVSLKRWIAAAAVFIIISGIWYFTSQEPKSGDAPSVVMMEDMSSGGDKAVLTLADGRKVVLDSTSGNVKVQKEMTAINASGIISYSGVDDKNVTEVVYNVISTPRGGQYKIVLSDGTKVWLNAASSMRFPTAFVGETRDVEITGEVYLEVTPNKSKPFTVSVNNTKIEVLGTHFNINAYEDEDAIKTTLLEGSVRILVNGKTALLKPGYQSQTDKLNTLKIISEVDTEEVVAWKDGYFSFGERANLQAVMRQIARWYDVEIVYEGNIPQMQFGGKISRSQKASDVLRVLELSNVRCKIEGRKIIVLP